MKNNKSAALGFIFVTLLIDSIGFGILIPVLPDLIKTMIHGNLSVASEYNGWLTFTYATMQFVFGPVIGNLSDRYGRRPVLLFSLFGFSIDYLFLAFAPNIVWFFVGRAIAGITGASFTTASAYIADITPPEKRAQSFGLIGVAFGLGFIIGPVIGGTLGEFGLRVPFYASAGLCLLNWLYGFFILPESLPKENRRPFEWKRANPLGSLKQLRKYPAIGGLLICFILLFLSQHAVQSTWSYFTMYRFGWSKAMVGYSLGVVGVMIAIVQGGLIRVIIPKLGPHKSVYLGLLMYCLGNLLFGLAVKSWMMFAFLMPYALGGISGPAIQGIISTQVPANEQGELQGGLTSLMSITTVVGPLFMAWLFAFFTKPTAPLVFPGMPFLVGAVLTLAAVFEAYRVFRKQKV